MFATARAALLLPCLAAPVVAGEECAAQSDCVEDDTSALLQLSRSSSTTVSEKRSGSFYEDLVAKLKLLDNGRNPKPSHYGPASTCPFGGDVVRPLAPSQTAFLVDQDKVQDEYMGWWDYPVQQDLATLERLKADMDPIPWGETASPEVSWIDMRAAPAKDAMKKMLEATHSPDLVGNMPEQLRGVYWMRGNGIPEELAVMQYGLWYEEERVLQITMQPFNWAWAAGKPPGAAKGTYMPGWLYSSDNSSGMACVATQIPGAIGVSWAFEECKTRDYCDPEKTKNDDMAFGYMQVGYLSNLVNASSSAGPLDGWVDSDFTMQAMSDDGSHWKRTCRWGFGGCAVLDFGSYDLVRVMGYDGTPVQPYYDEFVEYMGDVPLMVWTGWDNATVKQEVAQAYAEVLGTGTGTHAGVGAATDPARK